LLCEGRSASLERPLRSYLAGSSALAEMPLDRQGTPFQLRVWHAWCASGCGTRLTDGELAERAGVPRCPFLSRVIESFAAIASSGAIEG